jgi:hypothetical protein
VFGFLTAKLAAGVTNRSINMRTPSSFHSFHTTGVLKRYTLQVLNRTWINLVDLIECRVNGTQVSQHKSQNDLRLYIHETGKIFPKAAAKSNGFLKVLLITLY